MEMNKEIWGKFVVSKNLVAGFPVEYIYRKRTSKTDLNG